MIRVVKISYHRRLFIGLVAYSLLMAVCFAVFQYHRERQFKVQELDSRLQDLNAMILENLPTVYRLIRCTHRCFVLFRIYG